MTASQPVRAGELSFVMAAVAAGDREIATSSVVTVCVSCFAILCPNPTLYRVMRRSSRREPCRRNLQSHGSMLRYPLSAVLR